jgi:hypothetical protein
MDSAFHGLAGALDEELAIPVLNYIIRRLIGGMTL